LAAGANTRRRIAPAQFADRILFLPVQSFQMPAMAQLVDRIRPCLESGSLDEWLDLVEEVVRQHRPLLLAHVIARVPAADALDVLQLVLIGIADGLDQFRGTTDASLRSWCYRISEYKCIDYLRKKQKKREIEFDADLMHEAIEASAVNQPLSAADRLELECAMELLSNAKPPCYEYLWKHYILGLDYGEIAAEYAIGYDAARMRIERCLELAQKLLKSDL
jgi:RNA polymerase sigma factor (sigma-70 family)